MVELPHDRSLRQEVSPLAVSVTYFESLDGYDDLPAPGQLEASTAHLPKLSWESPGGTARATTKEEEERWKEREKYRDGREAWWNSGGEWGKRGEREQLTG